MHILPLTQCPSPQTLSPWKSFKSDTHLKRRNAAEGLGCEIQLHGSLQMLTRVKTLHTEKHSLYDDEISQSAHSPKVRVAVHLCSSNLMEIRPVHDLEQILC